MFFFLRVYNLLVADIMKTNLFYISYHSKYADLKELLDKSDHRSYPLVDSEGTTKHSQACRVCMGHGKPKKLWNLQFHFPGLESHGI